VTQEQLLLLPLWYVVFLLSVTCHEAAHAFAAYRGGDSTAYLGGQVSLNPIPHIRREFTGTILVPLISFVYMGWMMGWASAPYDPFWEDRHPKRAAVMAAAGPLANLALAVLGFGVLKLGIRSGLWIQPGEIRIDRLVVVASEQAAMWDGVGRLCSVVLTLNLVLFLFNLLPLPPMDGASVVAGFLRPFRELRDRMRSNPIAGLAGLVLAWYGFGYVFWPMYSTVLGWLYV
jgi:Zn-dependent protease